MKWDQEGFSRRIDQIIRERCQGNKTKFNKVIGQRSADYRWRVEGQMPSLSAVLKICDYFGVDLNWLILGEPGVERRAEPISQKELLKEWRELAFALRDLNESLRREVAKLRTELSNCKSLTQPTSIPKEAS